MMWLEEEGTGSGRGKGGWGKKQREDAEQLASNRALCGLMLVFITAQVVTGVSASRSSLLRSLGYTCWSPGVILQAIPVTVLTLGFHAITPFICKIVGDSVYDARRAILIGGAVPFFMVLSWNAVILGLASAGAYRESKRRRRKESVM